MNKEIIAKRNSILIRLVRGDRILRFSPAVGMNAAQYRFTRTPHSVSHLLIDDLILVGLITLVPAVGLANTLEVALTPAGRNEAKGMT